MFLDIGINDMIGFKGQKVQYNEVIITRKDILTIPKLMQFLTDSHIHFDTEVRLDAFPSHIQNEIGKFYFEYYGYIITYEAKNYLNKEKFIDMFRDIETIMSYFNRADILAPTGVDNTYNIDIFTTPQMNEIVLNFFNKRNRNFKSIEKTVLPTKVLYDIDLNFGQFSKVTNRTEFLVTMFDRYIRTQKGSIPFSGKFGSSIKESLQRKADYFTQQILVEEIREFVTSLSAIYPDDFTLIDIEYVEKVAIEVKLIVYVTLRANNEDPVILKVG